MEKHPLRGRGALWLGIPPGYQLKNLIHGTVALRVAEAVPAQSPVSASLEGPFWAEANPSRNHAAGAFEANRLAGTTRPSQWSLAAKDCISTKATLRAARDVGLRRATSRLIGRASIRVASGSLGACAGLP